MSPHNNQWACLWILLLVASLCLNAQTTFGHSPTLADDLLQNSIYVRMETQNSTNFMASTFLTGSSSMYHATRSISVESLQKHYESKGWKRVSSFPDRISSAQQMVHLTFALKSQNLEWLLQKAMSVSDPSHPDHENYLKLSEISQLTKPSSQHVELVMHYIRTIPGAVVLHVSKHENFISCLLPVSSVNKYLRANMQPYMHQESRTVLYRSMDIGYSLPSEISQIVSFVSGIVRFPNMKHFMKSKSSLNTGSNIPITPQVIWKRYNITMPTTINSQSSQAVASFLGQYFSYSDLSQFQASFNLVRQSPSTMGPNDESKPGVEASLDVQYIMGVGYKINTLIVSTPGISNITQQEPFIDWIIKQQEIGDSSPWVHSVSYGDDENTVTNALASQLDVEFMKFAASGRTVTIASGDDGAQCNNDGTKFSPTWPNTSWWVTSVGATQPSDQYWEDSVYWSGGGFSTLYQAPTWQKDAISQYLSKSGIPPSSFFNVHGRAYPDVAALGVNYQVVVGGIMRPVGGTSAACPCFAGIVSLMNDARFSVGKKPLGFLNIYLYQTMAQTRGAFFDITHGYNAAAPCNVGFPATSGYDAISGWGIPNFTILRQVALKK
ncbi:hypothetical protein C9374_013294 [Naegleria lovaniensis]|uniref:Peptidase S53 domain-containing protein n=1 Tax=Naegleria lovaniensis TaxID=51637 RepID=A0AA88KQI0_NAELO|nr:uncharacterized protein C9374_013294 [Naegleria lovaniensis]KAG2391809.1 hypothetical protein C9374_013294 [Naegleria lovaniensis]